MSGTCSSASWLNKRAICFPPGIYDLHLKRARKNVLYVYLISLFFSLKRSHLGWERYTLTTHLLLVKSVLSTFCRWWKCERGKEHLFGWKRGSLDKGSWYGKLEESLSMVFFCLIYMNGIKALWGWQPNVPANFGNVDLYCESLGS